MPCTRSMVDTGPPGRRFVRCSWTIARAKSIYSLYGKHSNQLSLHVKYYSHPPHPLASKLLKPYCPAHLPGERHFIYTGPLPQVQEMELVHPYPLQGPHCTCGAIVGQIVRPRDVCVVCRS